MPRATYIVIAVLSRYMYNLSADRILHRRLSKVHTRHGSPHRASIVAIVLVVVGLVPFVLIDSDPHQVYTVLVGVYAYTFVALLYIMCIAVPVYLHKHREAGVTLWKRLIAPALALIGLGVALLLSTQNFGLLIGGSQTMANAMFALVYGLFVVGADRGGGVTEHFGDHLHRDPGTQRLAEVCRW
ncbi:amino acid permease [Catenulispora rubra]|uniref:amino acid permease n=1 Tax=Catenulispora rubra TaxID=280293 RepID=UPI00189264C5|nr:amino acid permease [Catenulispora rubra]